MLINFGVVFDLTAVLAAMILYQHAHLISLSITWMRSLQHSMGSALWDW